MKPPITNRKSKNILRALMDPSQPDTVPWSSSELRAMLEHQLAAPFAAEIECFAEISGFKQEQVVELIRDSHCETFRELLTRDSPNPEMLRLVKDFAKAAMSDPEGLPRDVARVIYVSAILRGQRGGQRVTNLDNASVEREARRCLSYAWLPEPMRIVLRRGLLRSHE